MAEKSNAAAFRPSGHSENAAPDSAAMAGAVDAKSCACPMNAVTITAKSTAPVIRAVMGATPRRVESQMGKPATIRPVAFASLIKRISRNTMRGEICTIWTAILDINAAESKFRSCARPAKRSAALTGRNSNRKSRPRFCERPRGGGACESGHEYSHRHGANRIEYLNRRQRAAERDDAARRRLSGEFRGAGRGEKKCASECQRRKRSGGQCHGHLYCREQHQECPESRRRCTQPSE